MKNTNNNNNNMSKANSFTDLDGKQKHMRVVKGKLVHTGNANYIAIDAGIVHHPVNKIFKATMHKIK
jgi:desulfoferrodoxin (superoxide reductase-like protein)